MVVTRETIATQSAPAPGGHYSQAVAYGDLVFISGQLPNVSAGADGASADFESQARRALANLLAVLDAAGCSTDEVLKVTAYIVGIEHWPAFNRAYADVMGSARPARSVVPVPALHHGYLIEIDAVAGRAAKESSSCHDDERRSERVRVP